MDSKEYIASGIIERYVLGSVSDQERREVECMSSIYPELKEELLSIQSTIESYIESIAVEPPVSLKGIILEAIRNVEQESSVKIESVQAESNVISEKEEAKVVQLKPKSFLKWAAAAAIIPIIGMGVMYFGERNSRIDLTDQLARVEAKTQASLDSLSDLKSLLTQSEEYQALILDKSTKEILLAGTEISPESKARVFWSSERKEFCLVSDQLPDPISGKQYQLWAIASDVPVDLGVFDMSVTCTNLQKIDLENIQAFAITLEKEGGSLTPTMDQMYVVGAI
ncbi:MAG: anti-sigma factor [Crocinitomicaceae bacterium]|nr:anti-sigma factor [Flavobacteriales bacterium]NQZ35674.1 anti-sigma factor [Crocinitomicaceae bacterium]